MIRNLVAVAYAAVTDRKGVTAAEYAILAVAIIGAVALAVAAFSTKLTAKFTGIL